MVRGAWWATVHGVAKSRHDLATTQQQKKKLSGLLPQFHYCSSWVLFSLLFFRVNLPFVVEVCFLLKAVRLQVTLHALAPPLSSLLPWLQATLTSPLLLLPLCFNDTM